MLYIITRRTAAARVDRLPRSASRQILPGNTVRAFENAANTRALTMAYCYVLTRRITTDSAKSELRSTPRVING